MTPETDPQFEELLVYLKRSRGFDFGGYKRSSLGRRIRKRMQTVNIERFGDYVDYLEVHPDEFAELFNTILINVTGFFRDPTAWEALREQVLQRVLTSKKPDEPIRVWSAGCASGQEAYTVAILLAEGLGLDAFRDRVKIYGTDVDADALNQARQAVYTRREVEGIPAELLSKYFEETGERRSFRKDLRRSVIFGRHDLIQDAPISRLDLLTCRNVLMYFNAETQGRILDRFHFAVNEDGFLMLGKAEMLLSQNNSFQSVDLKRRLFVKVSRGGARERTWRFNVAGDQATPLINHVRLREAAFETAPVSQVVLDARGHLTMANHQARAQFGLSNQDLGQPFADLERSFRPLELRPAIDQAVAEGRTFALKEVEWRRAGGETEFLDVQVLPLRDNGGVPLGVTLTFAPVTAYKRLQEELQRSHLELESAYEELQSSNEELETTNEELQSTVEELETTNEELQSTNEELETMNEELQSANEELQTMNEELRQRSDELNQVNTFLQSILASFRGGVVVVDQNQMVLVWNHKAEDLWGLRSEEVQGVHFMNLDIGLPVEQLHQPIRSCLSGEKRSQELILSAVNRRGRPITCQIVCTPLLGPGDEVRGAILLMEAQEQQHQEQPAQESPDGEGRSP